jgi:hypothetical protein
MILLIKYFKFLLLDEVDKNSVLISWMTVDEANSTVKVGLAATEMKQEYQVKLKRQS